jgi:hypothetical protein
MDAESNENFFELRNYDALLGRFKTTDPYAQFYSHYLAMGNSHPNMVDPDGGFAFNWAGAAIGGVVGGAVGYGIAKAAGEDDLTAAKYASGGIVAGFLVGGGLEIKLPKKTLKALEDFYFAVNAGAVIIVNSSKPYDGRANQDGYSGETSTSMESFNLRVKEMTKTGRKSKRDLGDWVNRKIKQGYVLDNISIDGASGLGSDLPSTRIQYNFSIGRNRFSISPPTQIDKRQIDSWQGSISTNLNTRLNINVQRVSLASGPLDACFAANMRAHVSMSKTNSFRIIKFYGKQVYKKKIN